MTALTQSPTTTTPATSADPSALDLAYSQHFAQSKTMAGRAANAIAGGIAHDSRRLGPFPIYTAHAAGTRKTLVDGHTVIDYVMGHGALLFGHSHPEVMAAVAQQAGFGTHFGSGHDSEVRWAEAIQRLVPSAERVRFVGSGTEATLLAMRLARATTGRDTMILIEGHFHGWQDYATLSQTAPYDGTGIVPGLPDAVRSSVVVMPHDMKAIKTRLALGDIAGVILEPSGAAWAQIAMPDGFLADLRAATLAVGSLLIFDEVISGFRWSPGGAQALYNVTPDITTLAKIVAGGLPGGAVVGTNAVMERLAFRDADWNKTRKVGHQGTFNANPLSAVAGLATLALAADPQTQETAARSAATLRIGMNAVLTQKSAPGFVYGQRSIFHYALGWQPAGWDAQADAMPPLATPVAALKTGTAAPLDRLSEIALLLEGIHVFRGGGFVSAIHSDADIEQTLAAWARAIDRLQAAGYLLG